MDPVVVLKEPWYIKCVATGADIPVNELSMPWPDSEPRRTELLLPFTYKISYAVVERNH
jgi:hypothetical protein